MIDTETSEVMYETEKLIELQEYKKSLNKLGGTIDNVYRHMNLNVLPDLLKAHDKSGKEIGKKSI